MSNREALQERLAAAGQAHLLDDWDQLTESARERFAAELEAIDWDLVHGLFHGHEEAPDWAAMAARAEAPQAFSPATAAAEEVASMRELGEEALRAGRVGMILVAGGQGTRLGFPHPKGMLPLGPVSKRTLFEILIDRLRAVGRRYDTQIPLYLMTSPATHEATVDYFTAHGNCGLPDSQLSIFCQGVMPSLDAESGQALRSAPDELCLSPDGHGGMLAAFDRSGCLAAARQRGIDILFYGQVDNPLLQVCDPPLLGCHLNAKSEMTTQVVRKVDPAEKVGNVVEVDGAVRIIEYSDLPAAAGSQVADDGSLKLWAGNLAVHVFDRSFLERMVQQSERLPFHRARKVVEHIDESGQLVQPEEPNAVKFERFIFDLLPAAERAVVFECDKQEAFAPVKNAPGAARDTARHAQEAMIAQATRMFREAGFEVQEGVPVEINPLRALDAAELRQTLDADGIIDQPTYLAEK